MKIFVLNLERAKERRQIMAARLEQAGLDAEFFPAVDGKLLDREKLELSKKADGLSTGELGCYLSHVEVWKTVVSRNLQFACVLEDDVVFDEKLGNILNGLPELKLPFDVLRLSALKPIVGTQITKLTSGEAVILPRKNPSGTQAYVVSRGGAEHLLMRIGKPSRPIDDMLDNYWAFGLCIPVVSPPPVYEDVQLESLIQHRYGDAGSKGKMRHLRRVARSQLRKLRVALLAWQLRKKIG